MTTLQCLQTSSRVGIHGNLVSLEHPCKLGTSCLMYALDSSRTTPLVDEVMRQDMLHFSRIPMSRVGVSQK
jgi:hypothetical protein